MSYTQNRKVVLTEKKLESLRRQLYGKDNDYHIVSRPAHTGTESQHPTDSSFLRHDLLKTAVLASIGLAIQLGLYFAASRGLINFS